jgi:RNA polymerase sigma-70 factor (ECF subfamily)
MGGMSEEEAFRELIRKVRTGDQQAAAELVRKYEPEIRRVVRLRLTDPRLNRVLDSMDICQSVLANFFVRVHAGQFELDRPEQLLKLLVTMARNRLLDQARRQQAGRRDARRIDAAAEEGLANIADSGEGTPSQIVSHAELLQRVRSQLTEEERQIADRRALGEDWAEIAKEVRSTPEAVRKKLGRALDRITRRLGLDVPPDVGA